MINIIQLKILLTGPPQIIARSPGNITEYVENNVTLVCTVIGNPNPRTSWKYSKENGKFKEIESISDKIGGNYTIYTASVENSGRYVCNSSNSLGWDSYMTTIMIKPGKNIMLHLLLKCNYKWRTRSCTPLCWIESLNAWPDIKNLCASGSKLKLNIYHLKSFIIPVRMALFFISYKSIDCSTGSVFNIFWPHWWIKRAIFETVKPTLTTETVKPILKLE